VVNLNDLYQYNTANLLWTNLSIPSYGIPPSPRYSFGFDCIADRIYLFGGFDDGLPSFLCPEPHSIPHAGSDKETEKSGVVNNLSSVYVKCRLSDGDWEVSTDSSDTDISCTNSFGFGRYVHV
jgi:hypothetical protein